MADIGAAYLSDVLERFQKMKEMAESAAAQVNDEAFFAALGAEDNSIAVIMKHMAGNLRSRFSDFLTTDGEKPDRNRDGEFETASSETRRELELHWDRGWRTLFETLASLGPADLLSEVRIRREPHTVLQAIDRQVAHQSYHTGQVVLLAKHHAGADWKTLSIPRHRSGEFNKRMLESHGS